MSFFVAMTAGHLLLLSLLCVSTVGVWPHDVFKNELSWLEVPCTADSDCKADLAVCFKGKCLCSPGYYYSRTKNICVSMCPYTDLQPTFVKYPGCAIGGYNMASFTSSRKECLARCAESPRCRTVDYPIKGGKCYMQPVTPLDVNTANEWRVSDSTYDSFQRTCL